MLNYCFRWVSFKSSKNCAYALDNELTRDRNNCKCRATSSNCNWTSSHISPFRYQGSQNKCTFTCGCLVATDTPATTHAITPQLVLFVPPATNQPCSPRTYVSRTAKETKKRNSEVIDCYRICSLTHQNCTTTATSRNTVGKGMRPETPKAPAITSQNFIKPKKNQRHTFFKTKEEETHKRQTTKTFQTHKTASARKWTGINETNNNKCETCRTCQLVAPMVTKQQHQNWQNEQQRPNVKTASTDSFWIGAWNDNDIQQYHKHDTWCPTVLNNCCCWVAFKSSKNCACALDNELTRYRNNCKCRATSSNCDWSSSHMSPFTRDGSWDNCTFTCGCPIATGTHAARSHAIAPQSVLLCPTRDELTVFSTKTCLQKLQKTQRKRNSEVIDCNRICSLTHQNCTTTATSRNNVRKGMHPETPNGPAITSQNFIKPKKKPTSHFFQNERRKNTINGKRRKPSNTQDCLCAENEQESMKQTTINAKHVEHVNLWRRWWPNNNIRTDKMSKNDPTWKRHQRILVESASETIMSNNNTTNTTVDVQPC